jgi:hypothetical protein
MSLVVNLFGGPGSGKSTTKAGLFFRMKLMGLKVEMVEEFAKELTYEEAFGTMENEMYMLAEQDRRQRRLLGQVDFIITDSPLLKSLFYVRGLYDTPHYRDHIRSLHDSYLNFNVWVNRVKPYATYGRSQTEGEADAIGVRMFNELGNIMHGSVPGDETAPDIILKLLDLV